MPNLNKTKRRIRSINYTKKITSAMELVSTIKLRRYKNVLESFNNYLDELFHFMFRLIDGVMSKETKKAYIEEKDADKYLVIVISSNLGLCASFNQDVIKYVTNNFDKEHNVILSIGTKAHRPLSNLGYETIDNYMYLNENINVSEIRHLSYRIIHDFLEGRYKGVKVVYTKFINSIKFEPSVKQLLPVVRKVKDEYYDLSYKPIYDSDPDTLIKELIPMFITSRLYNVVIESEVSEQASRRNAMEAATDNADELIDKLTIEYNKARQANITQEITEVISGTLK